MAGHKASKATYGFDEICKEFGLPKTYTRRFFFNYCQDHGIGIEKRFNETDLTTFGNFVDHMKKLSDDLGDDPYSAPELLEKGIVMPRKASALQLKMSGTHLAGYFDSVKDDAAKSEFEGAFRNLRSSNYLKSIGIYKSDQEASCGVRPKKKAGEKSRMRIDQLWEQYHKTRDEHFRNLLIEHYRNLVKYAAERLKRRLPEQVDLDDMVSAGIFGLMDAIDAFDPERGVKFETYSHPRIRGAILDEMRSMDWVPRLVRSRAHMLDRATHSLESTLGRKPYDKEIAEELNIDMDEYILLVRDASASKLISLDIEEGGGHSGSKAAFLRDTVKDHSASSPVIESQKKDLKHLLTKGLTRAERLIVVLYYHEDMTMKEIGATLDLSESRVSQMHDSILQRLKAQMGEGRKVEFDLDDASRKRPGKLEEGYKPGTI